MCTKTVALLAASLVALAGGARADVSISNKPTQNMDCQAGVCTAMAKKAVLNVGDLQTMLASGDVAVKTGNTANDININQPVTWSSTSRLTLDAQRSVIVNKPMTVTGTGALSIITNDGGENGQFIIARKASVQFWDLASSLIIGGNSYTLVADLKTLAADIAANASGSYALAKPYDASVDGTYLSPPIGTQLDGTFEGLGNAISGLTVSANGASAGLLNKVGASGGLRDVLVTKASVSNGPDSDHSLNGIMAAENDGIIANGYATGTLTLLKVGVLSFAGGLVGKDTGVISDSSSNVSIQGRGIYAGGVVGFLDGSIGGPALVERSSSAGNIKVQGGTSVGGLVSDNSSGTISLSHASNDIETGNDSTAGGLVGGGNGVVDGCYATGSVKVGDGSRHGGATAGGLLGSNNGVVTNSYATGNVSGGKLAYVGGFVGRNNPGNISA
ncbi:MAG: hypothetical protein ACJ8EL_20410, partial [Rhizomicrobium sp.]